MSQVQTISQRQWRVFIDTFLNELIELTACSWASFIDISGGRERYVFASSGTPLPDINWHLLIETILSTQKIQPKYWVLTSEQARSDGFPGEIGSLMQSGDIDSLTCVPVSNAETLFGIACMFYPGGQSLNRHKPQNLRSRIEGIARLTAYGLEAVSESQHGNGEQLHHDAIQRLPDGLLMTDSNGVVIESNKAFTAITGIPGDRLVGTNLRDQSILGTDCDYLVVKLLESGQPFEIIARITSENEYDNDSLPGDEPRESKYLRLRGTAYPTESTPVTGMLLLATDVTYDVISKREANKREKRHSHEIELASRLQQNFFPSNYQKKRIRISTRLLAARELAGDFFDIFELGPNTIGLIIGDVVGKGIPGSLMAMSVHGMLANQAGALTPPMKVLERVNEALYNQVKGDYWYATCFYAKIHVTQLRMTFARAGHELPLWWHQDTGDVTFLEGEGLPLGIFPDNRYFTQQVDLNEGDKLLLYTDGLTDSTNPAGERFGHDRLVDLFRKNSSLSSKNLIKVIENEVVAFHTGLEQLDDIAIALVSVVPDSWTSLAVPPYTFSEVLENLLDELKLKGVDDDTLFKVRLSLDECVTNAFRHGHSGDSRRSVTIGYLVEPDKVTMKVRDQGPGFDFGLIPDPTLKENLMQAGGRGVFITLKIMDEVSFNDVGNEVTVVKYLHVGSNK